MLTRFLTHYHPRYIRLLIYMLQASEYDLSAYFAWYWRVRDFSHVEKRKTIDWTLKARLLWLKAWSIFLVWSIAGLLVLAYDRMLIGLLMLFAAPYIVAYTIALPVLTLRFLQRFVERAKAKKIQAAIRAHKGYKIAIAGSFGKSTMREILKAVLGADKKVAAPGGSYNTLLGIGSFVEQLNGDEDVLVFELGEYYPGDVHTLCEVIDPDMGIITGVNEAHLEKFKTIEKTTATIFELADWLKDKPLYVNRENERADSYAHASAIRYSRDGAGEWRVKELHSDLSGTNLTLCHGATCMSAHSQLLGLHLVGPLACATHIAHTLGLSNEQIQKGIAQTKPFDHRLQPRVERGVTILDDSYNGNPDGVEAVISFLASLRGRRWYITPGLVETGKSVAEVHRAIGEQLATAQIEKVILLRNSVTPHIECGLKNAGYTGEVLWYDDMPKALAALPHLTTDGDIVLIQNDWPDQYV